ncbi:MAG: alpha-hydroxy-acid oxidizing protein [Firmicutes bacterium]|nr:alpha-hydroxy-acid oxidizing protein [Bacillota bacterium]
MANWWKTGLFDLGVLLVFGSMMVAAALIALRALFWRLEVALGAPPQRTVWEWLFSLASNSPREIALTEQRAARGTAAAHPMGSPARQSWLDELAFRPATLNPEPVAADTVDTAAVIGPLAPRPIRLAAPFIVAPMAWGFSLTTEAKVALAMASQAAGVAVVSGEGPLLVEEVALSGAYILQYSRGRWAHQPAALRVADGVEIQLGQAAEGGMAVVKHLRSLPKRVRRALHRASPLVIRPRIPQSLAQLRQHIRQVNPDIPVGVKIPAGPWAGRDVVKLAAMGFDFITLEGAEAATASSPAVIHDHLGIPLAVAIAEADQALKAAQLRHRVTLVASGGVRGAADAAKLLALGADVVAVGTSLLFALAHRQVAAHLPFHPPTGLVFPSGKGQGLSLDQGEAFLNAAKWFYASRFELSLIAATVGCTHIGELGPHHLTAWRSEVAAWFGISQLVEPGSDAVTRRLQTLTEHYQVLRGLLDELSLALEQALPASS